MNLSIFSYIQCKSTNYKALLSDQDGTGANRKAPLPDQDGTGANRKALLPDQGGTGACLRLTGAFQPIRRSSNLRPFFGPG